MAYQIFAAAALVCCSAFLGFLTFACGKVIGEEPRKTQQVPLALVAIVLSVSLAFIAGRM